MTRVLVNSNGKAFTTSNNRVLSSSGITPSGSISITENDTYDVTSYASAVVNVSGSSATLITKSITQNGTYSASSDSADGYSSVTVNVFNAKPYEIDSGVMQKPTSPYTFSLPPDITEIGSDISWSDEFNNSLITEADFSHVEYIHCKFIYAFSICQDLTRVDFSSLLELTDSEEFMNAFTECVSLISVDFSSLQNVSGDATFSGAFYGCTSLETISFPSLETINIYSSSAGGTFWNAFEGCVSLQDIYFPALIIHASYGESFQNMLLGDEDVTVHFPSNLESYLEGWQDVIDGFGGTNTTVLFDLPATE